MRPFWAEIGYWVCVLYAKSLCIFLLVSFFQKLQKVEKIVPDFLEVKIPVFMKLRNVDIFKKGYLLLCTRLKCD
jgi:hypothetical protein